MNPEGFNEGTILAEHWVDLSTRVVIVQTNYLHKTTGMIIKQLFTVELVLDQFMFSTTMHYVSPVFETTTQVVYTIFSFLTSLLILGLMIYELWKPKE